MTHEELRQAVETLDTLGAKANGARLVARAWVDPGFKKRLLTVRGGRCCLRRGAASGALLTVGGRSAC